MPHVPLLLPYVLFKAKFVDLLLYLLCLHFLIIPSLSSSTWVLNQPFYVHLSKNDSSPRSLVGGLDGAKSNTF